MLADSVGRMTLVLGASSCAPSARFDYTRASHSTFRLLHLIHFHANELISPALWDVQEAFSNRISTALDAAWVTALGVNVVFLVISMILYSAIHMPHVRRVQEVLDSARLLLVFVPPELANKSRAFRTGIQGVAAKLAQSTQHS